MEIALKAPKTKQRFTPYQNSMAVRIFKLVMDEEFEDLAELIQSISTKKDYEHIHYAFYFKYDVGWLNLVEKFCGYEACKELGFYEYNFA